jgi:hypothetical protein
LFIAYCVTREGVCASGCSFGLLAAAIMKSDLAVHGEVTAGLGRWRDLFERGRAAMRERGTRRDNAGEAGGA